MGTVIGLIIIVLAIFLNRMLKIDATPKGEAPQPMNDTDNGDAWGRINTPDVSRVPYRRKNPDNSDDDYANSYESDDYNESRAGQWGSNTTSPDGYVPMYREDLTGNGSSDNSSRRLTPPVFRAAEVSPLTDSSENNVYDFSLSNYSFEDTLAVRNSETMKLAEPISDNEMPEPDRRVQINFNVREAIIYSAILNPKFKEYDGYKEDFII